MFQLVERNEFNGVFYRISDSNGEYKGALLGTVHLMDKEFQLGGRILEFFKQSKCLVVELDVLKVTDEYIKAISESLNLQNIVALAQKVYFQKMGLKPGVDVRLVNLARVRDMEIKSLETVEFQLTVLADEFDGLKNIDEDNDLFKQALDKTHELIKNCKLGAEAELEKLIVGSDSPLSEDKKETQFFSRNRDMADKVDVYLRNNDHPFIGVGVGHLLDNEKGLVGLLRAKGWTLAKV